MKKQIKTIVVNPVGATFIAIDGTSIAVRQGDPRLKKLIDQATPIIESGGIAELDFTEQTPENKQAQEYGKFTEKTNGAVRFFRMLKTKVATFLMGHDAAVTMEEKSAKRPRTEAETSAMTAKDRLAEVMEHAIPITNETQYELAKKGAEAIEETQVVAVVNNEVLVPEADRLDKQLELANQTGSKGLARFYERLQGVKRTHQVDELLNFLQRGDLPIAEDGRIIIYKVLDEMRPAEVKVTNPELHGCYLVDCHSRSVPQRPGAIVRMDADAVDPERRHECSTGLHVARRGYLSGFSGSHITLCKVAPEDVIAVPPGEPDKMRVCAYEILFPLSKEDQQSLRGHRGLATSEGLELLRRAMVGDHPPPTLDVYIGKAVLASQKVALTPLVTNKPVEPIEEVTEAEVMEPTPYIEAVVLPVDVAKMELKEEGEAAPVNPNDLKERKVKTSQNTTGMSRQETAADLLKDYKIAEGRPAKIIAAEALLSYKQQTKKSWEFLGISKKDADAVLQLGKK